MTQRAGTRPVDATGPQTPAPATDPGAARREAAEYPGGTVYLLHLDPAYKHARHYTGYAEPGNLQARLAAHAAGTGARLMQVIKEAGGTFRLARTWPGGRTRERELKNRRDAPRLCPICTQHPKPAQGKDAGPQQPTRTPAPAAPQPKQACPPAYERGAASARRLIQQQIDAGFSADQIAKAQVRILSAVIPERLRSEGREEARGYRDTAEAMIAAHRQASTPQPPRTAAEPQKGRPMSADTDTTPGMPPVQPATEWMKGARTAHDLIVRQAEAGYSADRIAERWDQALADYDDTTATPAEREWHAGAEETARDMIQTWRDMQRAEAEQRHATDTTRDTGQQADSRADWEAEAS